MEEMKKACCVFGHRKVEEKELLKLQLDEIFEKLIVSDKVDTFYLGSRSEFNDLCVDVLKIKKEKFPHIKRIYVRAEYPFIDKNYEQGLLEHYEETYFPEKIINSGKAKYIERNCEMIDKSDICIVYFRKEYLPAKKKKGNRNLSEYQPKSGTDTAYKYAVSKKRKIINLAKI